jgi:hypothetical protein
MERKKSIKKVLETSTKNEKFKMENGKLNLFEIDKLYQTD